MKENKEVADTNVGDIEKNSIEEDIVLLKEMQQNCLTKKEYKDSKANKKAKAIENILSDYKRVLKENEELKEYIAIAPNLDEMTATKYRSIQQDAYIQGRAEEQQKAEQIIYENYIPIQKIKDKIEELNSRIEIYRKYVEQGVDTDVEWVDNVADRETVKVLQELIEEREEK